MQMWTQLNYSTRFLVEQRYESLDAEASSLASLAKHVISIRSVAGENWGAAKGELLILKHSSSLSRKDFPLVYDELDKIEADIENRELCSGLKTV